MLRKLLFGRFMLLAVLVFIGLQAAALIKGRPRPFTEREALAVVDACEDAVSALEGELSGDKVVGVAHFQNDGNDAVTASMKAAIEKSDSLTLIEEKSVVLKFLGDVADTVVNATSLEEIVHAGRKVGMDAVIGGKVIAVTEQSNQTARAELIIFCHDFDKGETVFSGPVVGSYSPSFFDKLRASPFFGHPLTRTILWIAFVLLLPLLTSFGTVRAIERSSNIVSFILLMTYTILDAAAGIVLKGSWPGTSAGSIFLTILLFMACGIYNYWACDRIAKRVR